MAAQQDRQVGPGYNVPSSAKVNPSFFGHVAPARSGTPPNNPQAVKYYVTPGGTVTYRPNDVPPPQGSAEISAEQYQDSAGTIERSQSSQAMLKLNLEHAGFTDVKVSPAMVSYTDRRGMQQQPQAQGYSREAPTVQFSEKAYARYQEVKPEIDAYYAAQNKVYTDREAAKEYYATGILPIYGGASFIQFGPTQTKQVTSEFKLPGSDLAIKAYQAANKNFAGHQLIMGAALAKRVFYDLPSSAVGKLGAIAGIRTEPIFLKSREGFSWASEKITNMQRKYKYAAPILQELKGVTNVGMFVTGAGSGFAQEFHKQPQRTYPYLATGIIGGEVLAGLQYSKYASTTKWLGRGLLASYAGATALETILVPKGLAREQILGARLQPIALMESPRIFNSMVSGIRSIQEFSFTSPKGNIKAGWTSRTRPAENYFGARQDINTQNAIFSKSIFEESARAARAGEIVETMRRSTIKNPFTTKTRYESQSMREILSGQSPLRTGTPNTIRKALIREWSNQAGITKVDRFFTQKFPYDTKHFIPMKYGRPIQDSEYFRRLFTTMQIGKYRGGQKQLRFTTYGSIPLRSSSFGLEPKGYTQGIRSDLIRQMASKMAASNQFFSMERNAKSRTNPFKAHSSQQTKSIRSSSILPLTDNLGRTLLLKMAPLKQKTVQRLKTKQITIQLQEQMPNQRQRQMSLQNTIQKQMQAQTLDQLVGKKSIQSQKLNQRLMLSPLQSMKQLQKQSTIQLTKQGTTQRQMQRLFQVTEQKQEQRVLMVPFQIPWQITQQRLKQTPYNIVRPMQTIKPIMVHGLITIPPPKITNMPRFSLGGLDMKKLSINRTRTKGKYQPSLVAVAKRIYAKTPRLLTGLEVRPL